jgi:phage regulator Rha-like protein
MKDIIPVEVIEKKILLIRGHKVMLDKDLAVLYGVKPIRLREQVKRNIKRFPEDFMFQLNKKEIDIMVSQNAIPSRKHLGGYQPYVFTEQGVAMLSSVLNSERAVQVNIAVMRAFVKLREMLSTHKELAQKLAQLEKKIEKHDEEIKIIFDAIRQLMTPSEKKPGKKIGFRREKEN